MDDTTRRPTYSPGLRDLIRAMERIRREAFKPPYHFPPLAKEPEPKKT